MPCVPSAPASAWTRPARPAAQSEPFSFAADAFGGMATLPLIWSIPMRTTMVLMSEFFRERAPSRDED